jgi:hypothetical protein
MKPIYILNIPNYYCSYYLLGLSQVADLKAAPSIDFQDLNGTPFLVLEIEGKRVIIENDDPIGVRKEFISKVDAYFATNTLLEGGGYQENKVKPLFPHYPVAIKTLYTRLFGKYIGTKIGVKQFAKELYAIHRRPTFTNHARQYHFEPYIFFSSSIWKKESEANLIRLQYIHACKRNPSIKFEGGFSARSDGDTCGIPVDDIVSRYSSLEFSQKSAHSMISFNNPAVLNAVSWRLAEQWNLGTFVLSLPFKVALPVALQHGLHYHLIQSTDEFDDVLNYILNNPGYHRKICEGGKHLFQSIGLPVQQAKYIIDHVTQQ